MIGGLLMKRYKKILIMLVILVFMTNFTVSAANSLTLLVDHSGSMAGNKFNQTQKSTKTLLNMIELWGKIFPQKIGDLRVQYIKFGGQGEVEVLSSLDSSSNLEVLRKKLNQQVPNYDYTEYLFGIKEAINNLEGESYNNKTLFLTDGKDNYDGQLPTNIKYKKLGPTKFIVFVSDKMMDKINNSSRKNNNSKMVKQEWIDLTNGSEFLVNEEHKQGHKVTTLFMQTLLEFVNDIKNYIIRRGKRDIGPQQQFVTHKHAQDKVHKALIALPNQDISLEKITTEQGKTIAPHNYSNERQGSLRYVKIKAGVPAGEYKLHYDVARSYSVDYMSFEKATISLGVKTKPQKNKFIAGEKVNFNFYFQDSQGAEISYPDFLKNVYYQIQVEDAFETNGAAIEGMSFSHAYPIDAAKGMKSVSTGWSYDPSNLAANFLKEFEVISAGSLVDLKYDEEQCWEGRDLTLKASLVNPNRVIEDIPALELKTGQGTIRLTKQGPNSYQGTIKNLEAKTYQFSLKRDNLGLSKASKSQVEVQPRKIMLNTSIPTYKTYEKMSFWKKVKLGFSDLWKQNSLKQQKNYQNSLVGTIKIPYKLPYKDKVDSTLQFKLKINKLFPDERANLKLQFNGENKFAFAEVKREYLLGLMSKSKKLKEAVTIRPRIKSNVTIKQNSEYQFPVVINKKQGGMNFKHSLYPEPTIAIKGKITNNTQSNPISLKPSDVVFNVTTDQGNLWMERVFNSARKLFIILALGLMLILLLIGLIIWRRNFIEKLELWRKKCKNKSPEDFYQDFPQEVKKRVEKYVNEHQSEINELANNNRELLRKRALKKMIEDDDKFNKYIAKKFSRSKLEGLAEKVNKPNFNTAWVFYIGSRSSRKIDICEQKKDIGLVEKNVRVRCDYATEYARIEFSRGQTDLVSLGTVNLYVRNPMTASLEKVKNRYQIESSAEVEVGASKDNIYFKLSIIVTDNQIKINVNQ